MSSKQMAVPGGPWRLKPDRIVTDGRLTSRPFHFHRRTQCSRWARCQAAQNKATVVASSASMSVVPRTQPRPVSPPLDTMIFTHLHGRPGAVEILEMKQKRGMETELESDAALENSRMGAAMGVTLFGMIVHNQRTGCGRIQCEFSVEKLQ
jgi:hypothetical protein